MEKYNVNKKANKGAKLAKRILPFFAPLFFASVYAPSKAVEAKGSGSDEHFSIDALKISNFQVSLLSLYEELGLEAQGLSFKVFDKAVMGYLNMKKENLLSDKGLLTIVDFDKPSTQKRMWVIDLKQRKLLYNTLVAHGKNSGELKANFFSNVYDSNMSSLGFYVTNNTYIGKHGLSLKLDGKDVAYNSNALARNIVLHGADYVNEDFIKQNGRLGRSQGCPAVPMELHKEIIDAVQGGTVIYLHASDQPYNSKFLNQQTAMETFYSNDNVI